MGHQQPLAASVVNATPRGGGSVVVEAGGLLCTSLYLASQETEGAVAAVASPAPRPSGARSDHWG